MGASKGEAAMTTVDEASGCSSVVVSCQVLALPERCYRCGAVTRSVVGVLVPRGLSHDPDGFVPFAEVAGELAASLEEDRLAAAGIGRLRRRRSRQVPAGYVSNGCRVCDTIMGDFYLREALVEYLAEGGHYERLALDVWVDLEVGVLHRGLGM